MFFLGYHPYKILPIHVSLHSFFIRFDEFYYEIPIDATIVMEKRRHSVPIQNRNQRVVVEKAIISIIYGTIS